MPVGVFIDCLAVIAGSLLGSLLKNKLSSDIKQYLPKVFGLAALGIGINSVIKLESLPIVMISVLAGGLIGEAIKLDNKMRSVISKSMTVFFKKLEAEKIDVLCVCAAIFIFSGTGVFGAINEGLTGDKSILLSKALLDFFTAMIFASTAGVSLTLLSIPQLLFFLILFFVSSVYGSLLTTAAINNFVAVGGLLTISIGLHLLKVQDMKLLNLLPSFVLVIVLAVVGN